MGCRKMFVLVIDLICGALLTATLFMLYIHHPVMTELHEIFSDRKAGEIIQFERWYTVSLFFFLAFKLPSYLLNFLVMSNREHSEMYQQATLEVIEKTIDGNVM